jgi:hypothetical protein
VLTTGDVVDKTEFLTSALWMEAETLGEEVMPALRKAWGESRSGSGSPSWCMKRESSSLGESSVSMGAEAMLGMALEMKRLKENFVEPSDDLNIVIVLGYFFILFWWYSSGNIVELFQVKMPSFGSQ